MIIYNFNFAGVSASPYKTDSPLLVNPDAMLPLSLALQSFQPISRRNHQIFQPDGSVD
jgi:hypothetical protein